MATDIATKMRAVLGDRMGKPREKSRQTTPAISTIKYQPTPVNMQPAASFRRFVLHRYAVIGDKDSIPTNQQLLQWVQSLPTADRQSLVSDFISSSPWDDIFLGTFHREIASSRLTVENDFVRACMYQLALGEKDIATFTIHFSTPFLTRSSKNQSRKLNEVIKKRVNDCLKKVFGDTLPRYWYLLEYAEPKRARQEHGPQQFHIQGQIVADNEQLQLVKQAFDMASQGYVPPKSGEAVHLGEPSLQYDNRGGRGNNCLSDYPGAVRQDGEQYTFNWAIYCTKHLGYTQRCAERLGIDPGVLWRVSDPEITKEAEACLGLFKVLLGTMPRHAK